MPNPRDYLFRLTLFSFICLFSIACGQGLNTEPPLHDAAFRGKADKVKELLKTGISVNSLNREGATALHWAAFKGHMDVAKILLSRGADVNALTKKGSTPLRLATTHKKNDMIKFLKSRGGTIE